MSRQRIDNGQNTRTRAVVRVALLAGLMLSLAGCDMFGFRSWSWHQKLTVTVETPEGPKQRQRGERRMVPDDAEMGGRR
jgi:hypothetical protein